MNEFVEGDVVIVSTGQCGSVIDSYKREVWVLLRNNDIWVGSTGQIRYPQDEADESACPLDVERIEAKIKPRQD